MEEKNICSKCDLSLYLSLSLSLSPLSRPLPHFCAVGHGIRLMKLWRRSNLLNKYVVPKKISRINIWFMVKQLTFGCIFMYEEMGDPSWTQKVDIDENDGSLDDLTMNGEVYQKTLRQVE